jgi:hypothetical protein
MWGIFTAYMTGGAAKTSKVHVIIFASLVVLFFMLAAVFFGKLPAFAAGAVGIVPGAAAVYCSAAVIMNSKYGRWVLPIGLAKP